MRPVARALVVALAICATTGTAPASSASTPHPVWTPPPGSALAESLEDVAPADRPDLLSLTPSPTPPPSSTGSTTRCDERSCLTLRPATRADLLGTLPSEWIRCVGDVGSASVWTAVSRWYSAAACLGDVASEGPLGP